MADPSSASSEASTSNARAPVTRVLLVEDDPAIREVVADFLELLGCAVHTASNGQEALGNITRARPDVILLDYVMPVMDGREFGIALRHETGHADVPIVLISASPRVDEVCDAVGARACLRKPFDMDELAEIVEAFGRQ